MTVWSTYGPLPEWEWQRIFHFIWRRYCYNFGSQNRCFQRSFGLFPTNDMKVYLAKLIWSQLFSKQVSLKQVSLQKSLSSSFIPHWINEYLFRVISCHLKNEWIHGVTNCDASRRSALPFVFFNLHSTLNSVRIIIH